MKHAAFVSVLAFRSAWHVEAKRDLASAKALKAYRAINPDDQNASDRVVAALVDAIRHHPHWLGADHRAWGGLVFRSRDSLAADTNP
ncbi:MAG: hypothetical protein AAGA21_00920 [Pseudomonadota bacterium]